MEMLTLTQLAQLTDLAPPTVRRYMDDYILYVPSVRVEGNVGFPSEAVSAIRTIHGLTEAGQSHTEITSHLETMYPITVITSQPLGEGQELPPLMPTISALLQDVDGRYRAVHEVLVTLRDELGRLSTEQRAQQIQQLISSTATTTFRHFDTLGNVPADLTQIKQAIGVLATRLERSTSSAQHDQQVLTTAVDTLGAQMAASATLPATALAAVRAEVAEIRHTIASHAISTSTSTADAVRPELESLKQQITEMRQERRQMLSLMTTLQENLVQLQTELADSRQRSSVTIQHSTRNGQGAPHLVAIPQQADPAAELIDESMETGTDKLRTPRRLGHITTR